MAIARRFLSWIRLAGNSSVKSYGAQIHVGARVRFWAPDGIRLGDKIYIGKDVHIECNASIGSYALIANKVAFVGRHDHDFRTPGIPVRFGTWIGSLPKDHRYRQEAVILEDDVWVGYGAILLSGITLGRGAVVAAGSVVFDNVAPYTIVAGNPAKMIGNRFKKLDDIEIHERGVSLGLFEFSEKGPTYWVVSPGHVGESNS